MALTKTQDVIVSALGRRRSQLAAEIDALNIERLAALQAELVEVEAELKKIDPTINTLAEDAAAERDRSQALEGSLDEQVLSP